MKEIVQKKCSRLNYRVKEYFKKEKRKGFTVLKSEDVLKQFEKQNHQCFYCEIDISKETFHIDHYMPLQKKGLNTIENIRLTCIFCNIAKHDRMPEEFIAHLNFIRQKAIEQHRKKEIKQQNKIIDFYFITPLKHKETELNNRNY